MWCLFKQSNADGPAVLSWCLRLALAGVFLWAAAIKIAAPSDFARAVYSYRILPDGAVNVAAILLPWLELAVGAAFLHKALLRPAAVLAGALALSFALVLAINLARGVSVPCGCFDVRGGTPAGWGHVALDLAMAAGCAWLWRLSRRAGDETITRTLVHRGAGIVGVAFLLGLAANTAGPHRIPWQEPWSKHVETMARAEGYPIVDATAVRRAIETGQPFLLDARPPDDFRKGRIPSAMSLPLETFDDSLAALVGVLSPEQPVILYCSGATCDDSLLLARKLKAVGFADVKLYVAGFEDWTRHGEPVER
jgi:rhodanese-related sulfurtransferase